MTDYNITNNLFITYDIDFHNLPTLELDLAKLVIYIDYITFDEVTFPVMKGYDFYNRPFIVIKLLINDEILLQTFFKRYNDNSELYMGCGHATPNLICTYGGMTKIQFELLSEIINKGFAIIKKEHNPIKKSFINKIVYLYDENIKKKLDAIIYIQYAFRNTSPRSPYCI